ncbi:MAG: GNAT family N-acetyltransferase [Sphingomonas bacterium]|nr:GNAT family N-acetyltransferase [Sphingomonas bacterium]
MADEDFELVSVRAVAPAALEDFAGAVWGARALNDILRQWWLTSEYGDATAAIDRASGRIAGLCVAVPSTWELPGGQCANAVSICGWYVAPKFTGRGLGKMLVGSFAERAPLMNALSISDAAIVNFAKLGWVGPFTTRLRLLPLPRLRQLRRPRATEFSTRRFVASAGKLPAELASALDAIDAAKPALQMRRRRRASDWREHLAARPHRTPIFSIIAVRGKPTGYFVLRPTDAEAGTAYRAARLHYVSDLILNRLDAAILDYSMASIAAAAPWSAGAVLMCTSNADIAAAAARAGWLDEQSPILGSRLAAKAPRYMLGGGLVQFTEADIHLSFADSDVDLNI